MPKISEILAEREKSAEPWVAFEYFPPRTADGVANLYKRFRRMSSQKPAYADVTWGAGGTSSDLTLELCVKMKDEYGMEPNMHLTCTNMPVDLIGKALDGCRAADIRNIVALRGDAPKGAAEWTASDGGFKCALDLVVHMRKEYGDFFHISVAGYPEGHPNAITKVADPSTLSESEKTRLVTRPDGDWVCRDADYAGELAYLKKKVDAGADMIITQMFFDSNVFLKFVKDCRAAGIQVPIQPGIMLVQSYVGFMRMTELCKSRVPLAVAAALEEVKDSDADVKKVGLQLGLRMCKDCVFFFFRHLGLAPPRSSLFFPPTTLVYLPSPSHCPHPPLQPARGRAQGPAPVHPEHGGGVLCHPG